ncbi:MAG: hypothetical protein K8953_11655, partial [Proteobacteria bacterium]|nr:hypothetical protein [Pseudomonadota bacterium]
MNERVVDACTIDPFTKTGCENVDTIAEIRDTFCTETDIFDGRCGNANLYGATNEARRDVCLADTGTPTDPSCTTDALAEIACAPDPFNPANPGCENLDNNPQYKIAYCNAPATTWNESCDVEETYAGAKEARDLACRTYGTNTGGDDDCHDRPNILETCIVTAPFANNGCNTADGIAELRTTYCTTGPTNIFDPECAPLDGDDIIDGTNVARFAACVTNPFNPNCDANAKFLVADVDKLVFCRDASRNPAGKTGGCATTTTLVMTACGVNPGDPVCDDDFPNKVTVGDWSRAQPALLNTIPTEKNQFLTTLGGIISTQGTTAPTDITTVTLSDVYYDPVTISGDAADGFSYFT